MLGRDAFSAGDPITAESFYQHAEHYYRLVSAADANGGSRGPDRGRVVAVTAESPAVETPVAESAASEASADEAETAA